MLKFYKWTLGLVLALQILTLLALLGFTVAAIAVGTCAESL